LQELKEASSPEGLYFDTFRAWRKPSSGQNPRSGQSAKLVHGHKKESDKKQNEVYKIKEVLWGLGGDFPAFQQAPPDFPEDSEVDLEAMHKSIA